MAEPEEILCPQKWYSADFQEWVAIYSLDGVEDAKFEESKFQNILVKWDSSDENFVGFYDQ